MPPDERKDYLEALGVEGSGVDRLIKSAYRSARPDVVSDGGRKRGARVDDSAGHARPAGRGRDPSDIERGFIRAEVVSYDQLMRAGSYAAAREQGLMRLEGKEYVMQEGDVVQFPLQRLRHNHFPLKQES